MDQPGHGGYVVSTVGKQTWDKGLRQLINDEHTHFSLPTITKLDDARERMIIALCSHTFMSVYDSHDKYKNVLKSKDKLKLDEDEINFYKLLLFYEWFKIAAE